MNAAAAAPRPTPPVDWYLDHLLADVERFAGALEHGPTDAPVAACPGWSVLRLAEHLGQVHRWARFCVVDSRPPTPDDPPMEPFDRHDAAGWLRRGADELVATLRGIDPESDTWHPFPVDRVARVWPRRQAHETAMHRWDAEHAVGLEATLDADLASDGIDEYFEIVIPRLVVREQLALPAGSLHVHCTDVDGEWLVWADDGEYRMIRVHEKGDAALRGPAAELLLTLWGRRRVTAGDAADVSPIGDPSVVEAWLAVAGM